MLSKYMVPGPELDMLAVHEDNSPTFWSSLDLRVRILRIGLENYLLWSILKLILLASQSRNTLIPRNAIVIPAPKSSNLNSPSSIQHQIFIWTELFSIYRLLSHIYLTISENLCGEDKIIVYRLIVRCARRMCESVCATGLIQLIDMMKALKSLTCSRSGIISGCHWTPSVNLPPPSTDSITSFIAQAIGVRPGAGDFMPWWWKELTPTLSAP